MIEKLLQLISGAREALLSRIEVRIEKDEMTVDFKVVLPLAFLAYVLGIYLIRHWG